MKRNTSTKEKRAGLKGKLAAKLGLAVLIGLAGVETAHAGDFCIDYLASGGIRTIVAKRFKMPKAGKCEQLAGFSSYQGSTRTVSGPVCVASDGTHATFGLTGVSGNVALYYSIVLPLPLGAPGTISVYTNTGAVQIVSAPTGAACNPSPQPVP
jgi:hypothetical protein